MKKAVLFSTIGVLAAAGTIGQAGELGRVISSNPVIQQVQVPRQVCSDQAAGPTSSATPQCTTQTFLENRSVAYSVRYEYAGREYSVQMPYDPGPTIRLQVTPVADPQAGPPVPLYPMHQNPVTQVPSYLQSPDGYPPSGGLASSTIDYSYPSYPSYPYPVYGYPGPYGYGAYYPSVPIALSFGLGYWRWGGGAGHWRHGWSGGRRDGGHNIHRGGGRGGGSGTAGRGGGGGRGGAGRR